MSYFEHSVAVRIRALAKMKKGTRLERETKKKKKKRRKAVGVVWQRLDVQQTRSLLGLPLGLKPNENSKLWNSSLMKRKQNETRRGGGCVVYLRKRRSRRSKQSKNHCRHCSPKERTSTPTKGSLSKKFQMIVVCSISFGLVVVDVFICFFVLCKNGRNKKSKHRGGEERGAFVSDIHNVHFFI